MELLIGILCGIALSLFFSFGPAFFGLIQNSIEHGFRRAMAFAIGVSVSDVVVVGLMLTVLKNVDMEAVIHNVYVALIGGVGIAAMGVYTFRKKGRVRRDKSGRLHLISDGKVGRRHIMLHGFLLNFLNPFIWVYWISVIALLSGEVGLYGTERYIFFAGLLGATLGCDLLKCRLASLLQQWFTPRVMIGFNKGTGVVLMAFGIYMVVSMIVYQTNPKVREKEQEAMPQSTKIIQSLHNHVGRDSNHMTKTVAEDTATIYMDTAAVMDSTADTTYLE